MKIDFDTRIKHVTDSLKYLSLPAILVLSPSNIKFLTGFSGSNCCLLITTQNIYFFTDSRYLEDSKNKFTSWIVAKYSRDFKEIHKVLNELNIRKVGYEAKKITQFDFENLTLNSIEIEFVKSDGLIEKIRSVKDEYELHQINQAIELADQTMEWILDQSLEGLKEIEVSKMIKKQLLELGADDVSFRTIVATGLNSAVPHHSPDDSIIQSGDCLVIDMGAEIDNYRSDITRTTFIGNKPQDFDKIYDLVLEAQQIAINSVINGITGGEIDRLVRNKIEETSPGFSKYFITGLGHGVGLDIHEYPMLISNSSDKILDNSVFTVEPGLYLTGWGGIRIEDMVLFKDNHVSVLTKSNK